MANLWIRSQDKCKLRQVDVVYYYYEAGKHIIDCNGYPMGTYKSKERCLEIIDEIQKLLELNGVMVFKNIDFSDLEPEHIKPFKSIFLCSVDRKEKSEITVHNVEDLVYEMPEE